MGMCVEGGTEMLKVETQPMFSLSYDVICGVFVQVGAVAGAGECGARTTAGLFGDDELRMTVDR